MNGPPRPPPPPRPLPPPRPNLARPPASPANPAVAPIQAPGPGERMNDASKQALADMALGLLEEQVQARIVHYKADLDTNPELDAITAGVVAQLKQMQESLGPADKVEDRGDLVAAQEKVLAKLLGKAFPEGRLSLLVEKSMKQMLRALAKLFFQSELHEKTRGREGGTKVIIHGEQAIFYLLTRYRHRMTNELDAFDYASAEIKERSAELLAKFTKDMQDAFLSRRSNALKRMVGVFQAVLVDFFVNHLPKTVQPLAHEVIVQAGTAEGKAYAYKVAADRFSPFRTAFERRFMIRLVGFAEDELVKGLADTAGPDRDETLKFITDPHVFSAICGELTASLYDYLCNEGFLDIPPDWRHTH